MTNIRASGFESKSELQQHLDELDADSLPEASEAAQDRHERSAQLELSWLRREASLLRESLRIASGSKAPLGTRRSMQLGSLAKAVVPLAVCVVAMAFLGRKRARLR